MARCGHVTVFINFFLMVAGQHTFLYVRKGDNVTLECRIEEERMYIAWLGPPDLMIYALGNSISDDLTSISIKGNERNNEHFLQISDVSDKYIGAYECYTYKSSERHWYFNVILRSNPTCLTIVNATNNHDIFSYENREVTLECRVKTGQPKGYLQWKEGSKVLMKAQQNTLSYSFKPKRLDTRKSYTCEALNDAMEKVLENTVFLFVYYRPKVTILGDSSQYITEGHNLKLICQHDSNDENATLSWIWNTKPYPRHTGHSLVIRHVNRNQSGNYTCVIESGGGIGSRTVRVIVLYAPNVSIMVKETTTSKILHCKANGIPDKYTFDHWEHMIFLGEHIRYLNGTTDGKLRVPSAIVGSLDFYQNVGIYRCRVSNGIWDINDNLYQTSSKELTFTGKPFFLNESERSQFRKHGKDVSAEIYVYSCPKYNVTRLLNAKHVLKGEASSNDLQYILETIQTKATTAVNGRQFVIPAFRITIKLQNATETGIRDLIFVVENVYGSANLTIDTKSSAVTPIEEKKDTMWFVIVGLLGSLSGFLILALVFMTWFFTKRSGNRHTFQPRSQDIPSESQYYEIDNIQLQDLNIRQPIQEVPMDNRFSYEHPYQPISNDRPSEYQDTYQPFQQTCHYEQIQGGNMQIRSDEDNRDSYVSINQPHSEDEPSQYQDRCINFQQARDYETIEQDDTFIDTGYTDALSKPCKL